MAPTPDQDAGQTLTDLVLQHRVQGTSSSPLQGVYYIPDYVSQEEEQRLLNHVYASKIETKLSGRRLQNHGGVVHPKGLLQAPLPSWLPSIMERMHRDTGAYGQQPPNHVLVNAYRPGEGILPHEDGPAYFPGVCILSLAAPAVIRFRRKAQPEAGADAGQGGPAAEGPAANQGAWEAGSGAVQEGCCSQGSQQQAAGQDAAGAVHGTKLEASGSTAQPATSPAQGGQPAQESSSTNTNHPNSSGGGSGGASGNRAQPALSLLLMPRSLLVFTDEAYTQCLHGIDEVEEEVLDASVANLHLYPELQPGQLLPRGKERISLTVRKVTKVVKNLIRLGAR